MLSVTNVRSLLWESQLVIHRSFHPQAFDSPTAMQSESKTSEGVACCVPSVWQLVTTRLNTICSASGSSFMNHRAHRPAWSALYVIQIFTRTTEPLSTAQFKPGQYKWPNRIGSKICRNFRSVWKIAFLKSKSFRTKRGALLEKLSGKNILNPLESSRFQCYTLVRYYWLKQVLLFGRSLLCWFWRQF